MTTVFEGIGMQTTANCGGAHRVGVLCNGVVVLAAVAATIVVLAKTTISLAAQLPKATIPTID